ncbi:T9SS type A sorting domain-containing protein [Lacinutrix chionoecetis]
MFSSNIEASEFYEKSSFISEIESKNSNEESILPIYDTEVSITTINQPPPSLSLTHNYICKGKGTKILIDGNLNGETFWYIYKGSCGGSFVGITSGNSYNISPSVTTTYYVSAGPATANNCTSITVFVNSSGNPPPTECWETATYDDSNCTWIVTGTQPAEPTTACYETATFNDTTCMWEVTGDQPMEPNTACYETATFNDTTCAWEVTGTQPAEPTTACYETATFNDTTCAWEVTGTQPTEPTTACYETATFNDTTCAWEVTGTQPTEPTTACYETATFNDTTCAWEVTGTQPAEPTTACYETATFNDTTCAWEVTGTQPAEPTTACYETATFNDTTCMWDVSGTQPAEPTTACYETATFNDTTCAWEVTGTQPAEPTTACYETATFNDTTCAWEVSGTQPAEPTTACYETATFNDTTCMWEVTGTQPAEPTTACYETATFNDTTCAWEVTGTPPSVVIDPMSLPELCQGVSLTLTAESAEAVSYMWTTNETTQTIDVLDNGTYGVTITTSDGCTAYEEYIVTNYDVESLVSSYTIIAKDEVDLRHDNLVSTGAVGTTSNNGKVKVRNSSQVVGFVKSQTTTIDNSSSVGSEILSPAVLTLPVFVNNSINYNSNQDIVVQNGQTMTLNGDTYGTVEVKDGATLIFTNENIYLKKIKTKENATINFSGCTNVVLQKGIDFDENTTFNALGNMVVIYADDDVKIDKGSDITARIYVKDDDIEVKGASNNPTIMTGLFIAKKVKGDKEIVWSQDTLCNPCEVIPPPTDDCECNGGLNEITIAYPGGSGAVLTSNSGTVVDNGDGTYTISNNGTKLEKNFELSDGTSTAQIHTSCSQEILGVTFAGGIQVIGYVDSQGSVSTIDTCPSAPPTDDCECNGGLNEITVAYPGGSGAILTSNSGTVVDNGDGTYTISNNGTKLEKNFELSDGTSVAEIHTSCSQDILGVTFAGGIQVIGYVDSQGSVSSIDTCPSAPPTDDDCECDGGMVSLTLQYNGAISNAYIEIETKKGEIIYSGTHSTSEQFTFIGTGKNNRISNTIYLIVNGVVVGELHTSCSQPIYVGMVIGDFTIIAGESRNNGPLCMVDQKQANLEIQLFDAHVFPNPSSNSFSLHVSTDLNSQIEIEVYDLFNKRLINDRFDSNVTYKFGDKLETGMYIVKIKQLDKIKLLRIIKD